MLVWHLSGSYISYSSGFTPTYFHSSHKFFGRIDLTMILPMEHLLKGSCALMIWKIHGWVTHGCHNYWTDSQNIPVSRYERYEGIATLDKRLQPLNMHVYIYIYIFIYTYIYTYNILYLKHVCIDKRKFDNHCGIYKYTLLLLLVQLLESNVQRKKPGKPHVSRTSCNSSDLRNFCEMCPRTTK